MTLSRRIEDGVAALACNFRAFLVACLVIVVWALAGSHYGYSDTWQLIINTGTTIVTFLMVFLVGANQQRADATRQLLMQAIEAHTKLIEQHTEAWERHAQETHGTAQAIHMVVREMHELVRDVRQACECRMVS